MVETFVSDFNRSCLSGRAAIVLLCVAFVAAVVLHITLLLPYFHAGIGVYYVPAGSVTIGSFVGDEALYRLYAASFIHLAPYPAAALYPPLYPLLLALAELLSPSAPIEGMIILNIVAASAAMFPTYVLARQMLARDFSFGAAVVAGLLPASFIFTPALMSENLSTTLFIVAFWLAVRRQPSTLFIAGLFGVVGAFCFLTKFIFLAALPFLDAAFIINQWSMTSNLQERSVRIRRMVRLAMVAAAAGITPVALWSAHLIVSGGNVSQALGFHIAKIGFTSDLPPLAFLPAIMGLNGLAIVASALPVLPALLVGIASRLDAPIPLYTILLGSLTVFLWLFITVYAWIAVGLFDYPQPICQRYFMMLVPVFIPLAFVGVESVLRQETIRRGLLTLSMVALFSLALAIFVQAGLYDRAIWPVPAWITVIWVGGCDVLYGALGFPVVVVTGAALAALVVLRLVSSLNWRLELIGQRAIRFGAIAASTSSLAVFNVQNGLAGARFAWADPFLAINAAHARAITEIIGDRSRDPRPVLVTIDPAVIASIEKSTGIKVLNASRWWVNLAFWSGRQITVTSEEDQSGHQPHYWVHMARSRADLSSTYSVGTEMFQVTAGPR